MENWLKDIEVKADRVLDVGGGELPIKDRIKSWNVKEYLILDNDEKFKPDIVQDLNRVKRGEYLFPFSERKDCDVIFCLEVFEYLYNPIYAIMNLASWLKDNGGVLYISFPFIYPRHKPVETDCLRYTDSWIIKVLENYGFKQIEITERWATEGALELRNFYIKEGMHIAEKSNLIGYCVKAIK